MLLHIFKADVNKLIVKKGLHTFDMDYYTFGEKIMLLLAAFGKQPKVEADFQPYIHNIATNWREMASELVSPAKPFTTFNSHLGTRKRAEYINNLLEVVHQKRDYYGDQDFIANIFVWKDILEQMLPASRSDWMPFYGPLDYELERRHDTPLATFPRYEGSTVDSHKLLDIMKTARVKRLKWAVPLIGIEPELHKRNGWCFTLKSGHFEVFNPEVAALCRLSLDMTPFRTDFPTLNLYKTDLDKKFREKWFLG